ncbi:unnamed protein product [Durusdinium trenchii]|uniref:Uncharacterized protein n=1 Tax=Durusdinium trenchii TaxID=1381693 RepID=A0ABP0J531_9DINO
MKMGIVYWGCGLEGQGWDFLGRNPGGFPRIDRNSDALVDSWKGRMENAQVTLRMCASEGPGFKRYVKHFLMLSAQGCVEFRLPQYHRHNTLNRRKVLTERIVIGGILDGYHRGAANTGMNISNGGPNENSFVAYLRRRCRRYRAQANRLGGHFAAVILEGGRKELQFTAAARAVTTEREAKLKRILLVLGGPDGISKQVREQMREVLEEYTDFPLLGLALPGGILHSYYALATVLVFHDQNLLLPFLEVQLGRPKHSPQPPSRPPPEHHQPQPPKQPPPEHLLKITKPAEPPEPLEQISEPSKPPLEPSAPPPEPIKPPPSTPKQPSEPTKQPSEPAKQPPATPKPEPTKQPPEPCKQPPEPCKQPPEPSKDPSEPSKVPPPASEPKASVAPVPRHVPPPKPMPRPAVASVASVAPKPPSSLPEALQVIQAKGPPAPRPAGPVNAFTVTALAFSSVKVGLIWPLRPAAVYVPLLPNALVDFCGAPLPFVRVPKWPETA